MSLDRRIDHLEDRARPEWRSAWEAWTEAVHEPACRVPHEVRNALPHDEGGPLERAVVRCMTVLAPSKWDVKALADWWKDFRGTVEGASRAYHSEGVALNCTPDRLPAPPFVPSEETLDCLADRAGADTPRHMAAAILCTLGEYALTHHKYLSQ